MKRVVVVAGLLFQASTSDASQGVPTFRSGTAVVDVAVTVRDGKGKLVGDLAREDFVIREDGRPQQTLLFARSVEAGHQDELALDLGLLLDTSGSMAESQRLSHQAAIRFLDSVPPARDLVVIFFDSDIHVSRYGSEDQQGLFERIENATVGGTTALYDAIAVYLGRVQGHGGRKVLVVLSDGEDSVSRVGRGDVLEMARESGVTIYPIALQQGMVPRGERATPALAFLRSLAEVTGGTVFQPSQSKGLGDAYRKILDELETQYVLGFSSDNPRLDGRYRRLKVEVKRPGLRVTHRLGYRAPLPPAEGTR